MGKMKEEFMRLQETPDHGSVFRVPRYGDR